MKSFTLSARRADGAIEYTNFTLFIEPTREVMQREIETACMRISHPEHESLSDLWLEDGITGTQGTSYIKLRDKKPVLSIDRPAVPLRQTPNVLADWQ